MPRSYGNCGVERIRVPAKNMPVAEVEVTPDLVLRLLVTQHPDLADLPLTPLAEGWDNVMLRLGDDLVVRLPRRAAAAPLLENEQKWLPVIAPGLPLPIPVPVRVGVPGEGYPWAWSVLPHLPGMAAATTPPSDPQDAAAALGAFLGALHAPAPQDHPVNRVRGVPLAHRDAILRDTLDHLDGDVDGIADTDTVLRLWSDSLETPVWDGPPVWLHGDLHPGNLLVHEGRLSGVVDFGDITAGDPATDLSVAWMLLPRNADDAFRGAYAARSGRSVDDATWRRAWGWALALSVVFVGHSVDNPMIACIGRRTLQAVLADTAQADASRPNTTPSPVDRLPQ